MYKTKSVVLGAIALAAFLGYLVYLSPIGMVFSSIWKDSWGSWEQAAKLYEQHKDEFREILDTLNAHQSLPPIDLNYDPDSKRDRQIMSELQELTFDGRKVYQGLAARMKSIGIELIGQTGKNFDPAVNVLVTFVIFSSGILDNAASISVVYYDGQKPLAQLKHFSDNCAPLGDPKWYVCESKSELDH